MIDLLRSITRLAVHVVPYHRGGTDKLDCSGRGIAGAIRSLVNARILQLECARVMHESLLLPVLTYGNETMIWREKERSMIRTVQMKNLKGLLGIRRMNKFPNARIRQLYGVMKGVDEKIDEGVLQLFGHVEKLENDRIAERVYVGECTGSRLEGRLRKR